REIVGAGARRLASVVETVEGVDRRGAGAPCSEAAVESRALAMRVHHDDAAAAKEADDARERARRQAVRRHLDDLGSRGPETIEERPARGGPDGDGELGGGEPAGE